MFHFLIAVVHTGRDMCHSHKLKMCPFLDVKICSKIVVLRGPSINDTFLEGEGRLSKF